MKHGRGHTALHKTDHEKTAIAIRRMTSQLVMWRRTYLLLLLLLLLVRIYFALSPSYLHPDENFQGPEIIAGERVG